MNEYATISCLEICQPIGKFYIGVIDSSDLELISFVDVRRLENEERDIESYIGIQRPLSKDRAKEIGKYVNLVDATFPSNVILSISSENAIYDPERKEMKIVRKDNIAKVLDGQHRISGFENYSSKKPFQVAVAIFIDMELEDQAIVFATINQTQTKVQKSLVADLFAFAKYRSPQKTAHNIVRALNEKQQSPFFEKIKILGVADDAKKETITQATFVENILMYITKDKMSDRDIYKRGKIPERYYGKDKNKYIFRDLFLEENDSFIAQIIWNYFKAVSKKWPNSWDIVQNNRILNKSTGFIALMKFLGFIYPKISINDSPSLSDFEQIFELIDINENEFNKENYIPGASGINQLFNDLKTKSGFSENA